MNLFISYLFSRPDYFFGMALLVVFSICCHEFAHAWMALRQGDPTAASRGHLTLNPLRQMGIASIIMFLLAGIAWGSVPVNPRNFRHKYSAALTAFAGPCVNLILYVFFTAMLAALVTAGHGESEAAQWMIRGAVLNTVLFCLNMIPVPGFDGWNVLCGLFPRLRFSDSEIIKGSFFIILMGVFFGIKYLYIAGYFAVGILGQAMTALAKGAGL